MLKDKILSASGGGVDPIYVDDVFSTWLYTGNGSTQTITNGIDLAGKGGLAVVKSRSFAAEPMWSDTARGAGWRLRSDTTAAQAFSATDYVTAFNSNGFTVGVDGALNSNAQTYASWTFRKAEKFFDVVTWTGNGSNRTIAHNLGSVPGCIIVKRTDTASDWQVYHRSLANTQYMVLNTTAAVATGATRWNSTTPTSTVFSLGTDATVNANGGTYVAYLFAHDAGGFGATGNDNVISCGSFSMPAGGGSVNVNVGFEPQWVLAKDYKHGSTNWFLIDTQRGWCATAGGANGANGTLQTVFANNANSESNQNAGGLNATGFTWASNYNFADGNTDYIYIAIRRPHKPPTSGTQVFMPMTSTGTGNARNITGVGFAPDLFVSLRRTAATYSHHFTDRLRGPSAGSLFPMLTDVENNSVNAVTAFGINGISFGSGALQSQNAGTTYVYDFFRRAPGFFDVVCYEGNSVANRQVNHNLGVAPEMVILKGRNDTFGWPVYTTALIGTRGVALNSNFQNNFWDQAHVTALGASSITLGSPSNYGPSNLSGKNYVAYLFASAAGISKVGSYTGNGSSQTIDCGFAAGARFVLIKRTNAAGNWFVWDSARGINPAGTNDPYLELNTTAAEVTTNDSLSAQSVGFGVIQSGTNINVNAATYIFLAIA